MIIVKPPLYTLHDMTVRWLTGIAADLQREVARLKRENVELRQRIAELEAGETPKAMAAGAGD